MELLRECILALVQEATMFEEWLSPDVVQLLIAEYAQQGGGLGALQWEYTKTLGPRTWGKYVARHKKLYVSSAKTKDLFKQQVQTILHEIQHWNQHIRIVAANPSADPVRIFYDTYQRELDKFKYWNAPMEVDARRFADVNLEDAIAKVGKHYGGKVEGGSIDGVVEELMDEFLVDEVPLRRVQIGSLLRDYDLNTPENMKAVVAQLVSLGVKVI